MTLQSKTEEYTITLTREEVVIIRQALSDAGRLYHDQIRIRALDEVNSARKELARICGIEDVG